MQRLKIGDLVQVIAGKEKGKQGHIKQILRDENRVIVEGIKMVTKHQKPSPRNQEGGKVQQEAPIHASNVMLVDPQTGKPTRVNIKEVDGKRVRVSKAGNAIASE